MASSDTQDWLLRHPGIFEEIMLNVAHGSLEDLDNCRLVCRTWNEMIMNKIWESPTKKWGTIIQRRIESSWGWGNQDYYPSDEKISWAKLLGKHRLTDSQYYVVVQIGIVLETRGILTQAVFETLAWKVWNMLHSSSSLPLITCAASLAHHGLLGSVVEMNLMRC